MKNILWVWRKLGAKTSFDDYRVCLLTCCESKNWQNVAKLKFPKTSDSSWLNCDTYKLRNQGFEYISQDFQSDMKNLLADLVSARKIIWTIREDFSKTFFFTTIFFPRKNEGGVSSWSFSFFRSKCSILPKNFTFFRWF